MGGSEPSALWRSEDRGETFELVRGLWDHPHRQQWGAGFGGQAAHTVLPHPTDPARISVAMSTGGYYRSSDGGGSWEPANKGIKAYFFPDPWPEFGQCVHKVDFNRARPDQLWAQNHHGVYRSDDAGSTWISIAEGLPSDFGFPVVAHPRRPGAAYYFPLVADSERLPPTARRRVYRTVDEGATWEALTEGLPQQDFYGAVLRDAMCADDADATGVYVGTRTGSVFASARRGRLVGGAGPGPARRALRPRRDGGLTGAGHGGAARRAAPARGGAQRGRGRGRDRRRGARGTHYGAPGPRPPAA